MKSYLKILLFRLNLDISGFVGVAVRDGLKRDEILVSRYIITNTPDATEKMPLFAVVAQEKDLNRNEILVWLHVSYGGSMRIRSILARGCECRCTLQKKHSIHWRRRGLSGMGGALSELGFMGVERLLIVRCCSCANVLLWHRSGKAWRISTPLFDLTERRI